MAAYIHGNLATQERQKSGGRVKIKETRKVVYRTRQLPLQEKLLYLFTVCLCVVVAGAIIWRYAQIYQMNTQIHSIEKRITQLEAENSSLKEELSKRQDPELLKDDALAQGLNLVEESNFVRVPKKQGGQAQSQDNGGLALNR